ncbi:MAG: nitroreductase family protein [Anaerolineaceae bacterium]|nr:nitroreductase family protein [Anaerolineaceae bacterium]
MHNETLKIIHARRSIRKYQAKPISDTEMDEIVEAAIYAPTGMNLQGWHFSVVQNEALLTRIRRTMKENMLNSGNPAMVARASAPDYAAFHNAPAIIFISADAESHFAQIDSGIAAENICIAAESLNIGSCIMTSSANLFLNDADGALSREIGIPAGYRQICAITLGYKDEAPAAPARKPWLVNYVR